MQVLDYIIEEVRRQGHNIHTLDGVERVGWMISAWEYAAKGYAGEEHPTLIMDDIDQFGYLVEPHVNVGAPGFRTCQVRVGSRLCPNYRTVPRLLENLLSAQTTLTPIEFYKEFELIHPFRDGNGRTGKILLNWLNGTLLDPIFPPADLFGEPIVNP